jgi:hypothetical protein
MGVHPARQLAGRCLMTAEFELMRLKRIGIRLRSKGRH